MKFLGKTEGQTTTITRHAKHNEQQILNSGSAKIKKMAFIPILVQKRNHYCEFAI